MRILNFCLFVVSLLFSINAFAVKYELKSFKEFGVHEIDYNPKNTIGVFDIDNTLLMQEHILLDENNDLGFEYYEFCDQLAQKMGMKTFKFWNFITDRLHNVLPKKYVWVENEIPAFINSLQDKGMPVITCTASTLVEGDERLNLINEAGIDLTRNFTDLNDFSFFYSDHYFHPGHTSSKNKAIKIDEVVTMLNLKRLANSQDPITTVLFFDNRDDHADQVETSLKSIVNIHSFYYTFIKHSLSVGAVYEKIKDIK